MIEIKNITKVYKMGTNEVHALRGVSLAIEDGDFVAIMGPSGSGKSTLAHILGLLDVPSAGSYKLNQLEVAQLSEDELAILRRNEIGFIFQQFNLLPKLNAYENVLLPIFYSKKETGAEDAHQLLKMVGLGTREDHRPNELSGGQQQRVAIARSLVNRPRMILADEPTGNLDSVSEKEIMKALKDLNAQGITVVMVTHEDEIGAQAKRLIRMRDGAVQSDERLRPINDTQNTSKSSTKDTRTADTNSDSDSDSDSDSNSNSNSNSNSDTVSIPQWVDQTSINASASASTDLKNSKSSGFGLRELKGHFEQGFKSLAGNKIRTALSMLGILIGVAAVIAMLALGTGAQRAIEKQLSSLGSNLLVLRSGAMRRGGVAQQAGEFTRLTREDAYAIQRQIPYIQNVAPYVNGRGQVSHLNKNWNTELLGATTNYTDIRAAHPQIGRFFTEDENLQRARVAVIGMTLVRELFGGQNPIGSTIKINKISFQVIGVLPEKGAGGWRDQDDLIVVPLATAMYRLLGKNYVDSMDIQVSEASVMDDVQAQILEMMYARKRVALSLRDEAFMIHNMADIQKALTQTNKTMTTLLASIAAISLLVGGIGIMNIMLVSVTERTKEIGLRKAIGAKKSDILMQFLVESVAVSALGGVAGIILGWGICTTIAQFTQWSTSISLQSVLISFGFSALIGVIFGSYPAKKASSLHPIDALRYE